MSPKTKVKVALKYCGSCNPQVHLPGIANHLAQVAARHGFQLVPLSSSDIDVVIILCGCPRACGNKDEVRAKARHAILVAGESLGRVPVAEKDLAAALEKALLEVIEQLL